MIYDIQRASFLKRMPAWLLDMILLVTLITGFVAGLSYVLDVDTYSENLDACYAKYEEKYGIDFAKTEADFSAMTEEELTVYEAAAEELSKDTEVQKAYEMFMSLTLVTWSLGILGAHLILEFLIPLWLKNGQTLGKKVFGVALMRKDGIKVTPFMMFTRAILGKYTLETMIPVLLVVMAFFGFLGLEGILVVAIILLLQVIIPFVTRNKTAIHDILACTVAVDLSSQMIFNSLEEQLEYHKQLHEEIAAEADQ